MEANTLKFIIHHVVLPPKLPQGEEEDRAIQERELVAFVRDELKSFVQNISPELQDAWRPACNMLNLWNSITLGDKIDKKALTHAITNLKDHGAISVFIRAQNCGWIAYYDKNHDQVIIDAFEVSATSADVLAAAGSLNRCFPGQSVAIPTCMLDDLQFCDYLADNLCRLNMETVGQMCPTTTKARLFVEEERDTTHPGLVTEGLMVQLLAFGKHNTWASFEKHTRDEVNWENGKLPWRRSSVWFVIRVALQSVLLRCFPGGEGLGEYKNFMLHFLGKIGLVASGLDYYGIADHLAIIRAKIARRIFKLQNKTHCFVAQGVKISTRTMMETLRQIHTYIQTEDSIEIPGDFSEVCEDDLRMSLKHSAKHLHEAMSHSSNNAQPGAFDRSHQQRNTYDSHGLPQLRGGDIISLADFELWVDTQLQDWHHGNEPSEDRGCALAMLLLKYSKYARMQYTGCAEEMSLMILVMLELWVSFDKICISICSWFKDFSPEIPKDFLEPLLLPRRRQMERANKVESYIRSRQDDCDPGNPSIFDDPDPYCFDRFIGFARRYFKSSDEHKQLRSLIEHDTQEKLKSLHQEWEELSNTHRNLLNEASQLSHESEIDLDGNESHSKHCEKCNLERQAARLRIDIYEMPLPSSETLDEHVVFEISCPHWFAKWRDVTWKILDDFGGRQERCPSRLEENLLDYQGTQPYTKSHGQQLTLGSTTKSWTKTHYRRRKFPVIFDKVCVPNIFRFRLWNSETQEWVRDRRKKWQPTVKPLCTLVISSNKYSHLQYAVSTSRHVENKVVADQRNCHPEISLHEYTAFSHLRCGERLQWFNIIREIASPTLSMNEESVGILIRQAAWEFGSCRPGTSLRAAHQIFSDFNYVDRLVETIEQRLHNIKSNWNEHYALHTIVILGLRAINLSDDLSNVERAASFLRQCRVVAMDWCTRLSFSLDSKIGNDSLAQQMLLFKIAGICLLTYFIESQLLPMLLDNHEDLFFLTRSSILLFENKPRTTDEIAVEVKAVVIQTAKILHHVEARVRQMIITDPHGHNDAIKTSIHYLEISSPWTFYTKSIARWATNQASASSQSRQQTIHYNILSGELLIDNRPPGRLPSEYSSHPLFLRLFGSRALTVISSGLQSTTFTSTRRFGDSQIHFGYEEDQLIVKAQESTRILRLMSHDQLLGDFPVSFITKFTHWLDLRTGMLEFRPIENPWQTDSRNWHMPYSTNPEEPSVMRQDQTTLVDVRSGLFLRITAVLQTLDKPDHIHITRTAAGVIEARLVRLHLNFFVNSSGDLESREHHAMVDSNQNIECLYGLSNKLILRDIGGDNHRTVLIPYGEVNIQNNPYHTQISVQPPDGPRIKYFHYLLDSRLRMLRDTSGILGALYLAYLHAVTGFVLPDPAMGRTGTEEALRILRQARMKPTFPLDTECIDILTNIAALTPWRQYYPPHLKAMQTATWNGCVGEMAQHDDFRLVVQGILNHVQRFSPFHCLNQEAATTSPSLMDRGNQHLLNRAHCRHTQLRSSEFGGASASQPVQWSYYEARDQANESARSHRVYEIAALVRDWPSNLQLDESLVTVMERWDYIVLSSSKFSPSIYTYTMLLQLSLQDTWVSLYHFCQSSEQKKDSYTLISTFCTIAFGENDESQLVCLHSLLAIAFSKNCPGVPIPRNLVPGNVTLELKKGSEIKSSDVKEVMSKHYPHFQRSLNSDRGGSSVNEEQQHENYYQQRKRDLDSFEAVINQQWPCEKPVVPHYKGTWQDSCCSELDTLFKCWYHNLQFFKFLQQLSSIVGQPHSIPTLPPPPPRLQINARSTAPWHPPSLVDMMRSSNAPPVVETRLHPLKLQRPQVSASFNVLVNSTLCSLFSSLSQSPKSLCREYAADLSKSLKALESKQLACSATAFPMPRETIVHYRELLEAQRELLWSDITSALTKTEDVWKEIGGASIWPSITTVTIISSLASNRWLLIPDSWKATLLTFGKILASLRRCDRLIAYFDQEDINGFFREAEVVECEGWEASENPDWLLFEIENNLTIRPLQAEIARQMVAPDDEANAVLQLNMGEGKTSVITPIVALCLANGNQILRVVVLKPLLRQSVDLLSQRLGGLLNRPVYHIPFTRNTPLNGQTPLILKSIYQECLEHRGILICLPEQILSFRLVGLDQSSVNPDLADKLISCEKMLQEKCRTVIDESDEILDAKFQLVYARGNQKNVHGQNDRWEVIQCLLGEVERQAIELQSKGLDSLEIESNGLRFHFLKLDAANILLQITVDSIERGALPGLSFHHWSPRIRKSVRNFICIVDVAQEDQVTVRDTFNSTITLLKLLVLRGMLAYGILRFALAENRWLVDYGLHPSRCLFAVPYRAKGVPSESSEFGHPDVALTFTCLSYYYEGLTEEQVRQCFSLLGRENDPGAEYQTWVSKCQHKLSKGLHTLNGVNLEDKNGFQANLLPYLRYQKGILDFFLSRVVFPKEAKEFPFKLSTSAWDIPSKPEHPLTTGFSGTNDNRFLLPKNMPQKDLPHLLHTNALVLSFLLQEENRVCVLAQNDSGHRLTTSELLRLVNSQSPSIRVIIDVGAQIMESSNRSVAERWLSLLSKDQAEAVVFYDENDEATVVDRDGHIERLLTSPFRGRMHHCLVFLDQHHSRGVDIKLPRGYRAAVTLGPRLTKDRLVQACSRMRKLGNGQSVVFFIPPDVGHSLRNTKSTITSFDIIRWVLEQTCEHLEKLQPLWAWQGIQHHRCKQIWEGPRTVTDTLQEIVRRMQETESQTLFELYAPWESSTRSLATVEDIAQHNSDIQELVAAWRQLNINGSRSLLFYEEQEREISQEMQREQQVCRPRCVEPLQHEVHRHIHGFVKVGRLPFQNGSQATSQAIECLKQTSAGQFNIPPSAFQNLYVTRDFIKTIPQAAGFTNDEFLKQVRWILSNKKDQNLLIISQYEANELLSDIEESEHTTLHIYAPRTTKEMRSFHHLDFLTVGKNRETQPIAHDIMQALELFSGSLYFESFSDYERARQFFGLITADCSNIVEGLVSNEGYVEAQNRENIGWPCYSPFTSNPLPFLSLWISIRTKGNSFSQTHMGSIVEARPLTSTDRF